ncbi:hypothetical protein CJF30_00009776 [Rutstroemia sp. NJR-2017a BBW]|nr:hypothetical protein CJF30_00009776 [Rutstroemia sp. NJR-2017a BBW]
MVMELPDDELATHKALHEEALKQAPSAPRQNGEFWTAILPPHLDPLSSDPKNFHWFKVKGKHTVSKIQGAYFKKTGVSPVLRQGNRPVSLTEKMCDVNYFKDDIVVFWSTSNVVKPESRSSREPLQPLKVQPRTPSSVSGTPSSAKPGSSLDPAKVKPEPLEPPFSPHTPDPLLRQTLSPASARSPTPYQPLSKTGTLPRDPIAGYEIFADERRTDYNALLSTPGMVNGFFQCSG